MKWVTWEYIGVDRMACAWLIKRFIDPNAEFIFIPAGHKPFPEGAEPFDIPGVRFSHHRSHCTFYSLLKEYKLKDPVLVRIAQIVDEADVIQEAAVEPDAPGLDLACRALRRNSIDDYEAIQHGQVLYEGLYKELSERNETAE
jgi:hypothetical protein